MSRQVILLPDAVKEFYEAYLWYNNRELGLGDEFYRSLSSAVSFIARNPEVFRECYKFYRRALMRKFPYIIIYHLSKKTIYIYAIFHCSQNPEKWKKRLKENR